jgi:3-phenylpropionate/trans-cinnamate dioxygenase ferredoxin reductase subunit
VPGLPLAGVGTLRTLRDAQQLRGRLEDAADVLVVGAGFIGLEFATGAAQRGRRVTVLEACPRILQRSLSAPTAAFLHDRHTENGVEIRTGVAVARVAGRGGDVTGVQLTDGQVLPADIVVVGIGVVPNDELAVRAGLVIDRHGIVVDEFLRTSDPFVYAIGDVASFPSSFARAQGRVESVQNAIDQARCLAGTLSGTPSPYEDLPWFWSHQGRSPRADRGNRPGRRCCPRRRITGPGAVFHLARAVVGQLTHTQRREVEIAGTVPM